MSNAIEDARAELEHWTRQADRALNAGDPLEHAEASDKAREVLSYVEMLERAGRGKKPAKASTVATEAQEQTAMVAYLRNRGWLCTATANGAAMSPRARTAFARSGGSRGVPDLLVFEAVAGYFGLAIEMKRTRGGAERPEQRRWRSALTARGWLAIIAKGADDGIQQIEAAEEAARGHE
jgi:hypothetical protein